MGRTVFTSKGAPLEIGRELGKGGEGSVFEVPALKDQVAKLYHKPPDPKKQAKLSYMASTADAQLLSYVAWPQETLHPSRGGPVIGFLMPRVSGKDPIHMIYSPAHRRQDYPKAAWDFLLYVSRNVAASFESVHSHGHVIGDVNQNSFLVGRDSKVVLIDSDSFQVNAHGTLHLCEVGVAHFTPPELQSISSFDGFTRTANHDRFGLALLIFHVLFGGRHPFSGVPQRSGVGDALETDIKNFRYAYARDNQARGFKPPPRSIPITMLPDSVESMFHAAFTEAGAKGNRPTAQQWVGALDALRGGLRRCGESPMHLYPNHLGRCPWCALEQEGVVYFLDLGSPVAPTATGFVLAQVWALIQAAPAPQPLSIPSPNSYSVTAQPLPAGMVAEGKIAALRILVVVAAGAFVAFAPTAWVLAVVAGWVGWTVAGNVGSNVRSTETAKRTEALRIAKEEYGQLVERAQKEGGREGFQTRRANLEKLRRELEGLAAAEKKELDALHSTAQERQKQKFLEGCFIDSASIPGLGAARKAALRSFGIETAADVTRHRVMQVRGFGEGLTRAVLDWKASCERRFVFNAALAVSNADRAAVKAKFAARKATIERELSAGPGQLRQFTQGIASRLAPMQSMLDRAAERLAQAEADHAALRGNSGYAWLSFSSGAKLAIAGLALLLLMLVLSSRNDRRTAQTPVNIPVPTVASPSTATAKPALPAAQSAAAAANATPVAPKSGASAGAVQRQPSAAKLRAEGPASAATPAASPLNQASGPRASGREAPSDSVGLARSEALSTVDRAAIERVCDSVRRIQGAAHYEQCIRSKTAELKRNPPASIDGVGAGDVVSLARSCSIELQVNGPGAYNACVARGVANLSQHPEVDLNALSTPDRASIERACRATRQFSGPGPYNECVTRKVRELERSPLPDLSALSSFDRKAIERVCRVDFQFNGPGAYNTCLARKRVELERDPPHDLSILTQGQRSAVEAGCRLDIQYNGPGAFNACVARALREIKR